MTTQTAPSSSLMYRIASAACPRTERYWLAALFAEMRAIDSPGARLWWLLGAWRVIARANLRRIFGPSPLALVATFAGAVVFAIPTALGLELLRLDDDVFMGMAATCGAGFVALIVLALLHTQESSRAFPGGRP